MMIWPIQNHGLFTSSTENGRAKHTLDADKLSDSTCHLFFAGDRLQEETLLTTELEFSTLPPNTPLNDLFEIKQIQVGDQKLFWCSFPKDLHNLCCRIAATYGLSKVDGLYMRGKNDVVIRQSPKVLLFRSDDRCGDQDRIDRKRNEIRKKYMPGSILPSIAIVILQPQPPAPLSTTSHG